MKLAIRSFAGAFVMALAACSAPAPTAPAAAGAPALDVTTQSDSTGRIPNVFGSGN
jgi:hypothetical protein